MKLPKLGCILSAMILSIVCRAQTPVIIHVELTKPLGPYTPIYRWFGYDESNFTTMKYGMQLLPELHDLSPAPVYFARIICSPLGME